MMQTPPGAPTYQASPEDPDHNGRDPGRHHRGRTLGPPRAGEPRPVERPARAVLRPPEPTFAGTRGTVSTFRFRLATWSEIGTRSTISPARHPETMHYVLDGSSGSVHFGPTVRYADGTWHQHGAVPPVGAEIIMRSYRHGGGSGGNVGAGMLTSLRSTVAFIDSVTNIAPAKGGADAETVSEAKKRGPFSLRTRQRAVTPATSSAWLRKRLRKSPERAAWGPARPVDRCAC